MSPIGCLLPGYTKPSHILHGLIDPYNWVVPSDGSYFDITIGMVIGWSQQWVLVWVTIQVWLLGGPKSGSLFNNHTGMVNEGVGGPNCYFSIFH